MLKFQITNSKHQAKQACEKTLLEILDYLNDLLGQTV